MEEESPGRETAPLPPALQTTDLEDTYALVALQGGDGGGADSDGENDEEEEEELMNGEETDETEDESDDEQEMVVLDPDHVRFLFKPSFCYNISHLCYLANLNN